MKTFVLDRTYDGSPLPDDVSIVDFRPEREDLIGRRSAYRACLLSACRRNIPINVTARGFEPCRVGAAFVGDRDERDSLCELLSYCTFLFTDTDTAAFVGEIADADALTHGDGNSDDDGSSIDTDYECDPEAEQILRRLTARFGFTAAVLTDREIAYDGEKFSRFPGQ